MPARTASALILALLSALSFACSSNESGSPADDHTAAGAGGSSGGTGGASTTGGSATGGNETGGSATGGRETGGTGGSGTGGSAGTTTPAEQTVRVFWLKPSDVAYDQAYPDGIAAVMLEVQEYYRLELGVTFALNSPVVETIDGDQPADWYTTTPIYWPDDSTWWTVTNMDVEIQTKLGLGAPDDRWLCVAEISAQGVGGGSLGWVSLAREDADGAAGNRAEPMSRWYGGMAHELGHALGLPDSTSTDGTPMSASFYSYPDCHFTEAQKNAILTGRYGGFFN
jgi:hypothetical protein